MNYDKFGHVLLALGALLALSSTALLVVGIALDDATGIAVGAVSLAVAVANSYMIANSLGVSMGVKHLRGGNRG